MKNLQEVSFEQMYEGSFYTITGAGGDLREWEEGYNEMLAEAEIGQPEFWVSFTGRQMNSYYGLVGDNAYPADLHFLAFPLTGLNVSKLAMFKLANQDRWFDDIVDNNSLRN